MKKILIVLAALFLINLGVGFWWWSSQPKTSEAAFEKTAKQEARLDERVRIESALDEPDPEKIAELEAEAQAAWEAFLSDWPDAPEAGRAHYRLLNRRIELVEEPQARLDLIDAFLQAHPDHENRKDLLIAKARIYRFELHDPLRAIAVYREIEEAFPEDPAAAEAAMNVAQTYEEIREEAAAAQAYEHVAEAYPESKQAVEAQMRQARLLEEKLDDKREAAELYEEIAAANPGTRTGREAAGAGRRLAGEMGRTESEEYYDQTYGVTEANPYDITMEELNGPAMKRMREQGFDTLHYDVEIRIDPAAATIQAEATLSGRLVKPLTEPILLELNPAFEVDSIAYEGRFAGVPGRFQQRGPFVEIIPPAEAETEAIDLEFTVRYHAIPGTLFTDAITTAGLFLINGTHWFPGSHFGDSFTQRVTIETPEGYRAVSQGVEREGSGEAAGEGVRWIYEQTKPSQFMTLALGRYERLEFTGPRGLPMEVNLQPEHAGQLGAYRDAMLRGLEVFEAIYGPFPFDRLAVCEVPGFPGGYGAASLVCLGTPAFPEDGAPVKFLAHEIAHQWWGNLVGLDLVEDSIPWLSEAFATYSDAVFSERTAGRDAFLNQILHMGNFYRRNILSFEDRPIAETLFSHPMYRSLMYEKGALVIHALRREMGDEDFFRLLREFLDAHRFENVGVSDFAEEATRVAGRDLDWFFEQHLGRTGYARVSIEGARAAPLDEGWRLNLKLGQVEPAYRMKMDVELTLADGSTETVEIQTGGLESTHAIPLRQRPVAVRLDPGLWHLIDTRAEMIESPVVAEAPPPN